MSLIVQKFGGTSVADPEKIRAAAGRAIRAQRQGNQVVMVVSAMGKQTDTLVNLAEQCCDNPPAREMDMLLSTGEQVSVALMAMAIHALGAKAVSLTGGQIGIRTDSSHGKARIQSISTDRIKTLLDTGNIVIAAGFQGIDEDLNITTLGRGGSDTTAVALAAVLHADMCEIYTDVDGVFTTDPRKVAEARKLDRVSHDEMLELASLGAGVMHSRSIEFGKKFGVPIHVRNSGVFTDVQGTIIGPTTEVASRPVSGAALTNEESRITILGVPDEPGTSTAVFEILAAKNVAVDMIVQNIGADGKADISFTVLECESELALQAVQKIAPQMGDPEIRLDQQLAKVSVVGLGMANQTGVADRMFRALAEAEINIEAITTSQIKVSVLVHQDRGLEALRAVHAEFDLDQTPDEDVTYEAMVKEAQRADALDVVSRLQYMEDLAIEEIKLDDTQGRVTIESIPDQPGVCARIFEKIAAAKVLVDMILQSTGRDGLTTVSFTAPRAEIPKALRAAEELLHDIGGSLSSDDTIAILTVTGIGIRSHTGVGQRMFGALSHAGINVEMISTSEVRVNAVVELEEGEKGLAAVREAFQDVIG